MEVEFLTADTNLPPCLPLPWAMLGLPVSSTAKVHVRPPAGRRSCGRGGGRQRDHIYPLPHRGTGGCAGRSAMTVKRALRELEDAGLLLRVRQGFGEPNKIYVLIPRDAQKQDCRQAAGPV